MKIKKHNLKARKILKVMTDIKVTYIPEWNLDYWKENPRIHTKEMVERLAQLIKIHGIRSPLVVWEDNMTVYKGNLTLKAVRFLKYKEVPVVFHDFKSESSAIAYALSDNKASEFAEYDDDILSRLMQNEEYDLKAVEIGYTEKELEGFKLLLDFEAPIVHRLKDKYIIPPFSILDARQGYWIERKREWIALGIQGALGRGEEGRTWDEDIMKGESKNFGVISGSKLPLDRGYGKAIHTHDWVNEKLDTTGLCAITDGQGTSVFDPVLSEIMYLWFCPPRGHILDPFAGESSKGIVATYLGYDYTGIELRQEQVDANLVQAKRIGVKPNWIVGDSSEISNLLPSDIEYDMMFTSPPYYDLEIYSEDVKDGSAFGNYVDFKCWLINIYAQAVGRLRNNRFVVVKVGEIRDEKGIYRNFVADNIECFEKLGLKYYNEMILITSIGSLPIRVSKQFDSGRKIGKTHQNILVFYKGDPDEIRNIFARKLKRRKVHDGNVRVPSKRFKNKAHN